MMKQKRLFKTLFVLLLVVLGYTNMQAQNGNIQFADSHVKEICVQNWDTSGDGELSYDEAAAVTSLSNASFQGNEDITSFDELQYFTGITEIPYSSFMQCVNLTSVILPPNVHDIETMAFLGCTSLTSVYLHDQVVNVGANAWSGCSNVSSVYIGANVATFNVNPFGEMTNLEAFDVSPDNVTFASIDGLLMTADGTSLIQYPAGKHDVEFVIGSSITQVGSDAFRGCAYLKKLTVTQNSQVSTNDNNSYWYITSLEEVVFNEGIQEIGANSFMGCSSLTTIHFPSTLTYLGSSSFSGCNAINKIYSNVVTPFSFTDDVFTDDVYHYADVVVPDGSKPAYKETAGWSNFQCFQTDTPVVTNPEPYAVLSDNNTVLTFYYDDKKAERNGMSVGPFSSMLDRGWYNARLTITSLVIDASFADCTTITSTAYWFANCTELHSITGLENIKTTNVTDMKYMFYEGSSHFFTSFDLSTFDTKNVTDMTSMFAECNNMTDVNVSSFNTSNVTSMHSMFFNTNLSSLDVSNFNTSNVTDMDSMFGSCRSLTSLDVSGFNTDKVTDMGSMFSYCEHLENLDLSNFNTTNVTDMSQMFYGCSKLTSVKVGSFHTDNVTDMQHMFHKCSSLNNLDISSFRTNKVTNMESMFNSCSSLTSLDLSNFDTSNVTYNNFDHNAGITNMFYGCSSLTTIFVGDGWINTNLVGSNNVFYNCTNLVGGAGTTFDPDHIDYTYARIDGGPNSTTPGYFTDKNGHNVLSVADITLPQNSEAPLIVSYQFDAADKYTAYQFELELPEDLEFVMAGGTDVAFVKGDCHDDSHLVEANLVGGVLKVVGLSTTNAPLNGTSGVLLTFTIKPKSAVTVGQSFTGFIKNIEIVPVEGEKKVLAPSSFTVTIDQQASFEPYAVLSDNNSILTFYCDDQKTARNGMDVGPFENAGGRGWENARTNITTVVFDDSFANCTELTSTAFWFYGCDHLTEIVGISNLKTDNVTNMEWMFRGCSGLTILDVSGFKTENVFDFGLMFMDCSSLTSLDISNFKTDNMLYMNYMFYDCSGLTTLDMSNFKTDKVTAIDHMFYNCSGLTTIYAGNDWTTAAVTSGEDVFAGCTNLVGGKGTAYNPDHVDYTYARIDGGPNSQTPGYFTDKNAPVVTDPEPYAALSDNNTVLTFYCDDQKTARNGMDVGPFSQASDRGWANVASSVTKVVFDDAFEDYKFLTSTAYWFDGCTNLTEVVSLDKLRTLNVTDMNCMFYGCHDLSSLDVSNFKTDNVTNMSYMFNRCSGLTSLDVSNFKTDNVEYMAGMFCDCASLTSLDVSNFSTAKTTDMSGMFAQCSNLTTLDVSNFNTSSLNFMTGMFQNCSGLTSLDLSNFNTSNVTDMRYVFYECSNLATIYVGEGWNTASVYVGENMFAGCPVLVGGAGTHYNPDRTDHEYARIDGGPNSQTPGYFTDKNAPVVTDPEPYAVLSEAPISVSGNNPVVTVADVFVVPGGTASFAVNLKDGKANAYTAMTLYAYFPTTGFTTTGDYTVANVWTKASGVVGDVNSEGLAVIPFASSEPIPESVVNNLVTVDFRVADNVPLGNYSVTLKKTLFEYNLSDKDYADDVTFIIKVVDQATYDEHEESIVPTGSGKYTLTFYYDTEKEQRNGMSVGPFSQPSDRGWANVASSITKVVFDDAFEDYKQLTSTAGWFEGCTDLTEIVGLDKLRTLNVTNMSSMFYGCFGLTSLDVSHFNTENVTDMSYMFRSCSALTNLDVSGFKTDNVTNMFLMFDGCSSLTDLDVSNFNTSNVTDMGQMFQACYKLTSLDLSNFNTANVTNMGGMFNADELLTTLDLSTFNTSKVTEMSGMFLECPALTTIYVGEGWSTANVTSGYEVFTGSTNLVGGKGTHYDPNHIDYTYARIDGGPNSQTPGYFTDKNAPIVTDAEPYAVLSDNNTVLTFYYDEHKEERNGMSVGPFTEDYDFNRQRDIVDSGWDEHRESITHVVFDSSFSNCSTITSTAFWFFFCENLTTITGISNLRTDNVTNMEAMFNDCSSLTSLDVSGFNTVNVTDMSGMFRGCSALTNLDVSHFNTDKVTDMRNMFGDCRALTSLDVSHFNTVNVTDMQGMFGGCQSLVTLDLSTFNTGKVTNMINMFRGCWSLTSLNLSNFNTFAVTNMEQMFYGCLDLQNLDVSSFNTSSVINMYNMFASCRTLTTLDISSFDTNNVTDMRQMFIDCAKLKTIYAGNGWSTQSVTMGDGMFNECANLVGGAGTHFDPDHVDYTYARIDGGPDSSTPGYFTRVGDQPWVDPNVGDPEPYAVLSDNNTVLTFYYDDKKAERNGMDVEFSPVDNVPWRDYREIVTTVVFDNSFANCTSLNSTAYWFFNFKNLTSVQGISNLKTDNVNNMMNMFCGCSKLTELDVSHFNTSNVTNMYCLFRECGFTSFDLSNFNTENVTDMRQMFYGCANLTTLNIRGFNTANVTDMSHMFFSCYRLQNLDVSSFNTSNVTNMSYMFMDCGSLETLDLSGFNTSKVTSMVSMFEVCQNLLNLNLDGFNTANVIDFHNMFERCYNLIDLDISSFSISNESVTNNMFSGCTKLAAIQVGYAEIPAEEYANIGNPNLLVYVNEARLAPEGVQNVVVNGVAKEIVLTDNPDGKIVNNNWYCPEPFRAEKISYTREFRQQTQIGISRGWESLALPFAVQTITHQDKGAIAPFGSDASGLHFWLRRLGHEGLISVQMIEPNAPYIISMPNSEDYPERFNLNGRVTFAAQDAYVERTEQMADESADYMMVPAFQRMAVSEGIYALNVGEERNGRPEGSIFERNYREVRPFEAYTVHRGDRPAPLFVDLSDLEGSTTDVPDVRWMMDDGNGEWYDLQGRKLGSTFIATPHSQGENVQRSTLKKGVYIHNGRKTVVR